mmetsp:Transcript_23478/g.69760  ORF Transcript_23478/g.69760 Transcript_23478/m.69760 type:complete len:303 (-) Transcript_23478:324-1232(-)
MRALALAARHPPPAPPTPSSRRTLSVCPAAPHASTTPTPAEPRRSAAQSSPPAGFSSVRTVPRGPPQRPRGGRCQYSASPPTASARSTRQPLPRRRPVAAPRHASQAQPAPLQPPPELVAPPRALPADPHLPCGLAHQAQSQLPLGLAQRQRHCDAPPSRIHAPPGPPRPSPPLPPALLHGPPHSCQQKGRCRHCRLRPVAAVPPSPMAPSVAWSMPGAGTGWAAAHLATALGSPLHAPAAFHTCRGTPSAAKPLRSPRSCRESCRVPLRRSFQCLCRPPSLPFPPTSPTLPARHRSPGGSS